MITAQPDIVFHTMGPNANFPCDRAAPEIHRLIHVDFRRLRGALPTPRFIAVDTLCCTAERPESLGSISGWVESAAFEHKDYAEMARRMNSELKKVGL